MVRRQGAGGRLHRRHRSACPAETRGCGRRPQAALWPPGRAYVALRHWQPAIDDYARVVTAATTDDTLLSNQALALAETMLTPALSSELAAVDQKRKHLAMTKFTDPWQKLAAAYQLKGDQKAIDQLVERRPKSAGPIGDLFTQGKDQDKDWRRAIDLYSKGITAKATDALLFARRAARTRRSRIGKQPPATGRGPRPLIRMGPNCSPSSHDDLLPTVRCRWRTVSLKSLERFMNDRSRWLLKMTWSPRNWLNCFWISKKMRTPLDGPCSSRSRQNHILARPCRCFLMTRSSLAAPIQ